MELKQVLDAITKSNYSDYYNEELLKQFGDFLREDIVRSSLEAKASIPAVIKITNEKFKNIIDGNIQPNDTAIALEALRVIVNFLANSDDNRKFLLSTDLGYMAEFWSLINKLFNPDFLSSNMAIIHERIILMLSQFIHNTDLLKEFTTFLNEIDIDKSLISFMEFRISSAVSNEIDFTDLVIPSELFSEITNEMPSKIHSGIPVTKDYIEYLRTLIAAFNFALTLEIDEDDAEEIETTNEVFSYLSNAIYNITSCEDIPNISSTEIHSNILKLIPTVPTNIQNYTLNKRRLFSASGNIASMTNYDNSLDIVMSVEYFRDHETDPYILSACAINLGNYINSVERAESLQRMIENEMPLKDFVKSFLLIKFNDVIQYQAFHLFNNLMSCDIALYLLDNIESLISTTKVVIDNSQYYKEVYDIYTKFIKKLIRFAFIENKDSDLNMFQFSELWDYFNPLVHPGAASEEVFLILTQAFIATKLLETAIVDHKNMPFVSALIENLVSENAFTSQVSSTFVVEKLKTLGIFFKTITSHDISGEVITNVIYNSSPDQYHLRFVTPYYKFLQKLQDLLEQEQNTNNANNAHHLNIIQNNSKFVCATTLAYFNLPHEADETVESITSICQSILK